MSSEHAPHQLVLPIQLFLTVQILYITARLLEQIMDARQTLTIAPLLLKKVLMNPIQSLP